MRAWISFRTRSAIMWSRSLRVRPSMAAAASRSERLHSSKMLCPAIVTARVSGLSRAPWQVGHGTSRM